MSNDRSPTEPGSSLLCPAPLPAADPEQILAIEKMIAELAKPVEDGALDKVQEERELILQGKVEAAAVEELTGMGAEFAELVEEVSSVAITSAPDQAAERQFFME